MTSYSSLSYINLFLGFFLAASLTAVIALLISFLSLRVKTIFFAMVTLAIANLAIILATKLSGFTGGEDGIQAVPRGKLFGLIDLSGNAAMYCVVFTIFIAAVLMIWRIVHSPFGQVLKAIRENEPRALSLGYDTDRYKLVIGKNEEPWLIDLEKDPDELTNFYSATGYETIANRLTYELKRLLKQTKDPALEDPDLTKWLD